MKSLIVWLRARGLCGILFPGKDITAGSSDKPSDECYNDNSNRATDSIAIHPPIATKHQYQHGCNAAKPIEDISQPSDHEVGA